MTDRPARLEALAREYFRLRADGLDAVRRALPRIVTEDFRWESSGYPVVIGLEAMAELLDQQADRDLRGSEIEILHLAVTGDSVLTERIDTLYDTRGGVLAAVEIMGRLTFRGDRICVHRDYFDPESHR